MNNENLRSACQSLNVNPDNVKSEQWRIINALMAGKNVMGVLPTGFGKSLCFQVPAMCTEGTAIVFSPLISLMKDQVDFLVSMGVAAAKWNSEVSASDKKKIKERFENGDLDIIYITPESLATSEWKYNMSMPTISYIIIDEIHCMAQWGNDFRPEYQSIPEFIKKISPLAVMGCSATIDKYDFDSIVKKISFDEIVCGPMTRPNLAYQVKNSFARGKEVLDHVCMDISNGHYETPMAIFCGTIKNLTYIHDKLKGKFGGRIGFYHGQMDKGMRPIMQDKFVKGELDIIVATNAFGMGVNISNIRTIIHADIPITLANYVQESGRAGRDGKPSKCILYRPNMNVHALQYFFIETKNPGRDVIESVLRSLKSMPDYSVCAQWEVAKALDINAYMMPAIMSILKRYELVRTETLGKRLASFIKKKEPTTQPASSIYNKIKNGKQSITTLAKSMEWDVVEMDMFLKDMAESGFVTVTKAKGGGGLGTCFHVVSTDLNKVNWAELAEKKSQDMRRFQDLLKFVDSPEKQSIINEYFSEHFFTSAK